MTRISGDQLARHLVAGAVPSSNQIREHEGVSSEGRPDQLQALVAGARMLAAPLVEMANW